MSRAPINLSTIPNLNEGHREVIRNQLTEQFIHYLSLVEGGLDGTERVGTLDAIAKRIEAIKKVRNKESIDDVAGLDDDGIAESAFTADLILGRAAECLASDCPQNYSRGTIEGLSDTQEENLAAAADDDAPTDSLELNNIRVGSASYSADTKDGAHLRNHKFGILGFCVKDDRGHAITAKNIHEIIQDSLQKVQIALERKQKLITALAAAGDEDVKRLYRALIVDNNSANPLEPTNDCARNVIAILQGNHAIFNSKIGDLALRDFLQQNYPSIHAASERFDDERAATAPEIDPSSVEGQIAAELDKIGDENLREKFSLLHACYLSASMSAEGASLKIDEEYLEKFKEVIAKVSPKPNAKEMVDGFIDIGAFNPSDILESFSLAEKYEVAIKAKHDAASDDGKPLLLAGPDEAYFAILDEGVKGIVTRGEIDEETSTGNLELGEDEVALYKSIERENAPHQEEWHLPLWLKRTKPDDFKDNEFTDYDAQAYNSYVFRKKYPMASAFANFGVVGLRVLAGDSLEFKIAETLKSKKWGFFHHSTGGHWRLIVVSPDQKVSCLDSIGVGDKGALSGNIALDIEFGFRRAGLQPPESIAYTGLGTQRGVQCGLHSCLAMEEIVRTIYGQARSKGVAADDLYKVEALRVLSSGEIFGKLIDQGTGLIGDRNKEILSRAVNSLEDSMEEKGQLLRILSQDGAIGAADRALLARLRVAFQEEYSAQSRNLLDKIGSVDINSKLSRADDPIRHKPTDQEILVARWRASSEQLEDYHLDLLSQHHVALGRKQDFVNSSAAVELPAMEEVCALATAALDSARVVAAPRVGGGAAVPVAATVSQVALKKPVTTHGQSGRRPSPAKTQVELPKPEGAASASKGKDADHKIPKTAIKATLYKPLGEKVAKHITFGKKSVDNIWAKEIGKERSEKFRVISGIYDDSSSAAKEGASQKKIEETFLNIIAIAAKEAELTIDEVKEAILLAKSRGGIANKLGDKGYEKQSAASEDEASKFKKFKKFSAIFQREAEECGIFTGRDSSSAKKVGLRLTFLPKNITDKIAAEGFLLKDAAVAVNELGNHTKPDSIKGKVAIAVAADDVKTRSGGGAVRAA